MRGIYSTIAIVGFVIPASAINYYLSNKGSDLQSGTSAQTAWRNLEKLSEAMESLQPGDSVFFERGSVFLGTLKISSSGKQNKEIYFGAYGVGAKPIVSGSKQLTNWTLFNGNIWVADCAECSSEPSNLFIDGRYQTLGRYPNEGYLRLTCTTKCQKSLTDTHLNFADGYWDGAEVVAKSSRWTLDNLSVSNYFSNTFYFSNEASYQLPNGFGYFIQKHLATLDKPGEWFFEKKSKKVFLYFHTGDIPSNHKLEVSLIDFGLDANNCNFVIIENLAFKYQRVFGIQVIKCNNFLIRNCLTDYAGRNGMEINSCQHPQVENCVIRNPNNNGVEWKDNVAGTFIRNSIQSVGLHPGRGGSGNGTYIGLNITASNPSSLNQNLIQYNEVDSIGYIGIDFRSGGTSINKNLVSNFCMVKDDGAGIYTWGNSFGTNTIDGNIVLHGIGSGAGTSDEEQLAVSGIYIDDRSEKIDIKNNTVAYCSTNGIYIHNAKHLSISGNKLFSNGNGLSNQDAAELCIKLDALVTMSDKALDLQITENIFINTLRGTHCVYLSAEKEQDLSALGSFERNQYFSTESNGVIAKFCGRQDLCDATEELNLSEWQQQTSNDKNSSFKIISSSENVKGQNLIGNGSMTNNINGWIIWPSRFSIVQEKKTVVDGPSLRVDLPSPENEALLYHAGIILSSSKVYRLSFSAKSKLKSKIEFSPLMAIAPWDALDASACFAIDTVFKTYSYMFKPNKSFKEARVNFKSNSTFWIDNVTLQEVGSRAGIKDGAWQLYYNASEKPKNISLQVRSSDLNGNSISSVNVPPYGSIILKKDNHF